jgi:hypothetical protein
MRTLASFRELLLRKTDDNDLRYLIKTAADEVIADHVLESLEKMATNKSAGSHANAAIRDLGSQMDPELEPAMIREALGHHASRYKAALQGENQGMANKHAEQFFKLLDMVHKLQPHSGGKLHADAVDIKPWERTHSSKSETFAQRIARDPEYAKDNPVTRGKKKPHQFVNDTEGFSFKPKGNDWSFLQGNPHEAYAGETLKTGHTGAYPMERTKINGKYIPIEDVSEIHDGNFNHPFDHHPIISHYNESSKSRSPERDSQYVSQRDAYMDSEHVGRHLQHQEDLHGSGQLEGRGRTFGAPVHGEKTPAPAQPVPAPAQPAPAQAPVVRRSAGSAVTPSGDVDMSKLSPAARALLGGK